ncbi:Bioproteinsis of lysosome- organelles complex 1 subunit 2 [Chamberlinius hualienensis]
MLEPSKDLPDVASKKETDSLDSPFVEAEDTAHIRELSKDMFEKTAIYLQGELEGTLDDYKLLEEMNKVTLVKYTDMKEIAASVSKTLKELNVKYKTLQPYLEQIDQIEQSALKLEQAAYKLDKYSKRLELKFKELEKR